MKRKDDNSRKGAKIKTLTFGLVLILLISLLNSCVTTQAKSKKEHPLRDIFSTSKAPVKKESKVTHSNLYSIKKIINSNSPIRIGYIDASFTGRAAVRGLMSLAAVGAEESKIKSNKSIDDFEVSLKKIFSDTQYLFKKIKIDNLSSSTKKGHPFFKTDENEINKIIKSKQFDIVISKRRIVDEKVKYVNTEAELYKEQGVIIDIGTTYDVYLMDQKENSFSYKILHLESKNYGQERNAQKETAEKLIKKHIDTTKIMEAYFKYFLYPNTHVLDIDVKINDSWGIAPIHVAVSNNYINDVKFLLGENADIEIKEKNGYTPLAIACQQGHLEIAELLINKGADINVKNGWGATPVYQSSLKNHIDIVKLLLEKNADIEIKEKDGYTPLAIACQQGHLDIVIILIKNNANLKTKTNNKLSLIELATNKNHVRVVKFLKSLD